MSDTTGERPAEPADRNDVPPTPPAPARPPPHPPASRLPSRRRSAAAPGGSLRRRRAPPAHTPAPRSSPTGPRSSRRTPQYPASQHAGPAGYAQQAGQPYASSFGPPPQARPSRPFRSPAVSPRPGRRLPVPRPTARRSKKSGAGKVVGLIVAAAIVGGAAGLGGAYAGIDLFGDARDRPAAGPQTVVGQRHRLGQLRPTRSRRRSCPPSSRSPPQATPAAAPAPASSSPRTATSSPTRTSSPSTASTAERDAPCHDRRWPRLRRRDRRHRSDLRPRRHQARGCSGPYPDRVRVVVRPQRRRRDHRGRRAARPLEHRHDRHRQRAQPLHPDRLIGSTRHDGESERPGTARGRTASEGAVLLRLRSGSDPRRRRPRRSRSPSSRPMPRSTPATPAARSSTARASSSASTSPIATAGSAGQSGSIGVGFSIPSDIVKRITDELIANGAATHGLLGASVQSAPRRSKARPSTGAYIAEAVAGGAAEAAGLQEGDIVTEFNGVPDHRCDRPHRAGARRWPAAATRPLTYVRGDVEKTVDVTLGTLGE